MFDRILNPSLVASLTQIPFTCFFYGYNFTAFILFYLYFYILELFEGDIVMDSELRKAVLGAGSKRSGIIAAEVGKKKHWPNGIVPYVLSESLGKAYRSSCS